MSHVAAYTGSEALSGVMLDIVLHPHTVTQIPLPQLFIYLFLGGGALQISASLQNAVKIYYSFV